MKKFLMAVAGAIALFSVAPVAQAAPISGMDAKAAIARDGSQAEQTHMRRWRHCHRRCVWRHGHRHCWRSCHGGWGHHHHRHHHRC